ncbi:MULTISPECIES: hypothetical protein [Plesiomonas]|uniref:hypothetical protein n=1 Tax=Plesiomonas TaxID=702 RepID=UPI0012620FF4|nr:MULTISPECIES: hypothetical protein [Plesiomonas]KAB7693134.1 hypothetical protein GBN28_01335 [Plesiomonas shigelloides]MCE5165562.1 hypothetical protein [Plesiomonas sp. PI-19]
MDVFKLRHTDIGDIPLTRNNFEHHTQRKMPWFVIEEGEQRQFAVCPSCDNTIQIIRLYDNKQKPYGKHYMSRRKNGLGIYSIENYERCPYAARNRVQRPEKTSRRQESELTLKIKELLIENFDRVIYLLEKQLEMRFSKKLVIEMINDFIAAKGWRYDGATLQNIPWIFAYFSRSQSLFGRYVASKPLQEAISQHYPNAVWDRNYLKSKSGYISPRFCFLHHQRRVVDHHLEESIIFSVSDDQQQIIFEKTLPIEGCYFSNLVSLSHDRGYRNWELVDLAKDFFRNLI